MARDAGLEELVQATLGALPGLSGKAMFGGWAFLLHGNLLCACGKGGLMMRVGAENEGWALAISGVAPVVMRGRRMTGYVRAATEAYVDDGVRQRLLDAAVAFTGRSRRSEGWRRGLCCVVGGNSIALCHQQEK
jgi:TfoX N-terminal domain